MSWNPNYKRKSKTHTSSAVKDRYNRAHYEQITIRVGIGGKEVVQAMADYHGLSVTAYIRQLIIQDGRTHGNDDISAILGGGGTLKASS